MNPKSRPRARVHIWAARRNPGLRRRTPLIFACILFFPEISDLNFSRVLDYTYSTVQWMFVCVEGA